MNAVKTKADVEALRTFDTLPNCAFVRVGVVAALYSVTTVSIWAWAKRGFIPAPRKIGPNVTAWNVGALRSAIREAGK